VPGVAGSLEDHVVDQREDYLALTRRYPGDTMMTCPDCKTNLDNVPVGDPCPNCGSLRRDATIGAPTIGATAQVFTPTVSTSIDALLSKPEVKQVVETREITLRFVPPKADQPGWIVEAWDGEEMIAFAPGPKFDDVYLAAAEEIETAVSPPKRPAS
jgi:hypothetical protein